MNCILITLSIFSLILESSAEQNTTQLKISTKESKSFAEEFATILATFSATTVATVISPVILKLGFLPLILIAKIISKPLIMIGLTGWLMVFLTPAILARSGLTSPVFESRSQGSESSIGKILSTNMSVITTETMNFFNLNNDDCKLEMSCRLGKKLARALPYVQYFVSQSGAANWIDQKYMANVVRSMNDPNDCTNNCQSLNRDLSTPESTYSTDPTDPINNVLEWLG